MLYPFDFILAQKIFYIICLILLQHHDLWARLNPQHASTRFMAFPQQGMGSSCLGREGFWDNVGPPHTPEGAGQPLLVPLAWRWGGQGEHSKVTALGAWPKTQT